MQAGVNVDAGGDDLEAPLVIAAKVDNVDAVVALLQVGGDRYLPPESIP